MATSNYQPPRNQDNSWLRWVFWVGLILTLLGLNLAVSCSPKIYERVVYQHDTTYVQSVKVDSVFRKDSVFVREKGDTVFIYKERIRDRYVFRHDTLRLVKVDSVAVERVKEVKVEKPLSAWKSAKIGAFWWLVAAVLLLLLWTFRKPILKLLHL